MACEQTAIDVVQWRFTYRVTRDDVIVRQHVETFNGFLASTEQFSGHLDEAGFTPTDTDEPDVVIARRPA